MNRYVVASVALLCCTMLFSGGIAAGTSHYGISISGSVDTPDRQVTLKGQEYTVSAIGVASPGDAISIAIEAPANASYDLYLYDNERVQTIISDASSGETFDDEYTAGSYLVAIWEGSQVRAVHPVVVRSYEVSLNTPSRAEVGDTVEFGVDAANVPNTPEDLDHVQVVLSKDGDDRALTATESSDGSYVAETTLSETGTYSVYANVRGPETQNGQKELLGASSSSTVDVRDPTPTPTPTPSSTATPTNTQSSGGGETGDDTPTETPPATATSTATATPTSSQTSTATPTSTATTTATSPTTATPTVSATVTATAPQTATASPTATETPTPNNVVTPNQGSPTRTTGDPTTQTTGDLSMLVALVALVGFGLLSRREQ